MISCQWEQRNVLVASRTSILGPQVWAGAVNHRGCVRITCIPPIFPDLPLDSLQRAPEVGADPTKQQILMGTKDKHPRGAGTASRCHLIAAAFGTQHWEFSVFPKQTQFQTRIIGFFPFLPPFSDKKIKSRIQGFLAQSCLSSWDNLGSKQVWNLNLPYFTGNFQSSLWQFPASKCALKN